MDCIIATRSENSLIGHKHLKEKDSIPYTAKDAETPFTMKGAFDSESAKIKQIVILYSMRLTTSEGPAEFKTSQLYFHERAHKMILELPFTGVVEFDISFNLAKNHGRLNWLKFTL